MSAPHQFTSSLADRMAQFIAFKRMQGYEYKDGADRLGTFDVFLTERGYTRTVLDVDVMECFAFNMAKRSRATRAGMLSGVRQFSLYLHALEPESVLLPPRLMPRESQKVRFCPLSSAQVGELMAATATLKPDNGIRAACMRFLIGLLYSTGLRISEALALNLRDIDAVNATLFVRRGKFRKERLVAMSPSTREALDQWIEHRADYAGSEPSAPLFVPGPNRRLVRDRAHRMFRRLCIHCGIGGDPPPRLHDLRHNYACACLALWRETHEDVTAWLPVLANAMGHVTYHCTELYLHINAAALQQACGKFKQHYLEHQR
jgi:integrase